MSFFQYLDAWNCVVVAKLLLSLGVGVAGFFLAICLRQRDKLRGVWYTSLRHILTVMAIAGVSNAWSIVLLGCGHVEPTELLLHLSILLLLVWIWAFYQHRVRKHGCEGSLENVLKFLHSEVTEK